MAAPRPPRLALTDRAGRLRVVTVHETGQPVDVAPPLDAAAVEDGPLPRLTWPVWLAGGRVLVSATTPTGRPGLYAVEPGGAGKTLVYRPRVGVPPEIAPGVPFYYNPAPDGRLTALVTPADRALTLLLADTEEPGDPPEVTRGAPVFSTWSPTGDALLVHAGAMLHRMDRVPGSPLTTVGLNSVDVRVPAWSPDGQRVVTVRHGETRNALVVLDRAGRHLARIGAVQGFGTVLWSPRGDVLALGALDQAGAYAGVELVSVRSGQSQPLVRERCLMWVWSPDGRRLAYLRRAGAEGQLSWRVAHLDGRPTLTSAPFYPGPLFAVYVAFFDQYLLSQPLWSPDGRYLLAAGRIAVNGPPAEAWGGNILLWDTLGGKPLTALCPGEIGSWQA